MTNNGTMTIEVTPVINEAELEASAQKIADRVVELIREKFADVPQRVAFGGGSYQAETIASKLKFTGAQVFAAPLGTADFKAIGTTKGFEASGVILDELAETAFVVEPAKAEPRVFNVGDAEPEDRDSITLVGTPKPGSFMRGPVTLKYGRHGNLNGPGNVEWWQVSERHHTYAPWSYWLGELGPLTEVLDEPEVEPRKFNHGDVIPDGVTTVECKDGRRYTLRDNGKFRDAGSAGEGFLSTQTDAGGSGYMRWYPSEFPLTEVLPESEPEAGLMQPKPRVFVAGDVIPADVDKLVDADGYVLNRTPKAYGGETGWSFEVDRERPGGLRFLSKLAAGSAWGSDKTLTDVRRFDVKPVLPLTEVLPEVSTEAEPVVWQKVADIPANVTFTDSDGDEYYTDEDGEVRDAEDDDRITTDHDEDEYAPYTEVIA